MYKSELRALSTEQLLKLLITDRSKFHEYSPEIVARHAYGGDELLERILGNGKPNMRERFMRDTKPQPRQLSFDAVVQAIEEVVEGRKSVRFATKALLESGWDYIDPSGLMQKPPEEVEDFLQSCTYEIDVYAEMHQSRRNLLKMIIDAYLRAVRLAQ